MKNTQSQKQPALYLSHGGGPCFWMDMSSAFGPNAFKDLGTYLQNILSQLPQRPTAILLITAHWEEKTPTISMNPHPSMLYDYYGFPEHTYHLQYPAPNDLTVAHKAQNLLEQNGITTNTDTDRGFDHGVFVPMLMIDPEAKIPVTMMSLKNTLSPEEHFAMGQALRPLRDENILIIASGSSYHNLREFTHPKGNHPSLEFDQWLTTALTSFSTEDRKQALLNWAHAPQAHICHPREEHFAPIWVAAGAGAEDIATQTLSTKIGGKAISCYQFG